MLLIASIIFLMMLILFIVVLADCKEKTYTLNEIMNDCGITTKKLTKVKKIFCFIDRISPLGYGVAALCEDGTVVNYHISSNEDYTQHDIGITSEWGHKEYKKHCPDGYELVWVDYREVKRQYDEKEGEVFDAYVKSLNQERLN